MSAKGGPATGDDLSPVESTTRRQRDAANPATSAFVSANAGSGKTKVLTNRVARLLLAGAEPQCILCITFTKAAAAEMADRLFRLLGEWALADEPRLRAALADLQGDDATTLDANDLAAARRLFARALETPGGLRIQTIHSFCESVLRRFPLEAGVAPGFTVVEESEALRLAEAAVDGVVARADAARRAAIDRLTGVFSPAALRDLLLSELASPRRAFAQASTEGREGWEKLAAAAATALGVDPHADEPGLISNGLSRFPRSEIADAYRVYSGSTGDPLKYCAPPLGELLAAQSDAERWRALYPLFFTGAGTLRKQPSNKELRTAAPWISDFFSRGQAWFERWENQRRAAIYLANARALYDLLEPAFSAYQAAKAARAALDFNDLIARTGRLFADDATAGWVMYKLDQGLEHILLDEAQDTGPDAWETIEGPLKEFFSGEGGFEARRRDGLQRTFFAVGDQKQSIYSFQGANAALFNEKSQSIGKNISAVAKFENISLDVSFRSAAPVLRFVDAAFADPDARQGVTDADMRHGLSRTGAAGRVELWPLAPRGEQADAVLWDAPLDAISTESPEARLTAEIAGAIRSWLDGGERLESRGRPIRAGDIMILVQSRSRLFNEMIRALSRAGVAVAGPDRTTIGEDAAVQDVFSYARAAVSPFDNLSLAETLKSPFFNYSDDDLYALAHDREGTLWEALVASARERPLHAHAAAAIEESRRIGLRQGTSAFIAHLLESGAPSGRARLAERLGAPSVEPVEELMRQAIALEALEPPSLQLFLDRLSRSATIISRDPDRAGDVVRVMTAHKAKGLEAPIVFLLDTHRLRPKKHLGPVYVLPASDQRRGMEAPVLAPRKGLMTPEIARARDLADEHAGAEHRRLFYVAATRAEDRLYICGVEPGKRQRDDAEMDARSWRWLAETAFERLEDEATDGEARLGGVVRRIAASQTAPIHAVPGQTSPQQEAAARTAAPAPAWLRRPLASGQPGARKSATALATAVTDGAADIAGCAYSPISASAALLRGSALHRLLELLPGAPVEARVRAADRLLARMAPGVDDATRALWREEALAVIAAPDVADAFGPGSQAEVAIVGELAAAQGPIAVAGRIDRLFVDSARILCIDYKTNQPPPQRAEDAPEAYLNQLAAYRALLAQIYPGRRVDAALLWTFEARLMMLPANLLDRALERTLA